MSGWRPMKHQMPGALATCLGFLAASVTPSAATGLFGFLNSGSLGALAGGFLFFSMYSAPVTLVFAVPAYLLLRLFAPAHSRWVLAIGIFFGASVGALVAIAIGGTPLSVGCYAGVGAAS